MSKANESANGVASKKVEVQLPVVKLRIEDLAYLQGLQKEGVKCSIPHGKKDRLELLGLAEYKTLPPCPKEMAEYRRKKLRGLKSIRTELMMEDPNLENIRTYAHVFGKPQERRVFVLTKAGAQLLSKGKAMVQVKGGRK